MMSSPQVAFRCTSKSESALQKELATVESKLVKVAEELRAAEEEQQALRDDQSRFSKDISDAQAEKSNLEDYILRLEAEMKNLKKKKDKAERDCKSRADEIANVEKVLLFCDLVASSEFGYRLPTATVWHFERDNMSELQYLWSNVLQTLSQGRTRLLEWVKAVPALPEEA